MPGDTIYMRARRALRERHRRSDRDTAPTRTPRATRTRCSPLFDWQKKVRLAQSRFGPAPAQPTHDNWGPLVVPPQHYFMMGDNRYNSKDSRYWGFVPRDNVRGRPLFVYYTYVPQDESDRALSFAHGHPVGRIGHVIR